MCGFEVETTGNLHASMKLLMEYLGLLQAGLILKDMKCYGNMLQLSDVNGV